MKNLGNFIPSLIGEPYDSIIICSISVLLIAIFSQISISIPFQSVPITGQTFMILLVAGILGAYRGSISVLLYLFLGLVGLPIFTNGTSGLNKLLGPTGGYLIGMLISAFIVGYLADLGWTQSIIGTVSSLFIGIYIIFFIGVIWLSINIKQNILWGIDKGLKPFLPGELLKIILLTIIFFFSWKYINK